MKNYQIFNAYQTFEKIINLNYKDYDINVDIALMFNELTERYQIITMMLNKLNNEYCAVGENGQYLMNGNNPVMKPGKSLEEYNRELAQLSNADANYDPEKIVVRRDSFRDVLPNPKDILLLKDFITFEKEDKK